MTTSILYAIFAGALWGLAFVSPMLLPMQTPTSVTLGRYLFFGLAAIFFAWQDRTQLRNLPKSAWRSAAKLSIIGNFLYYFCLSFAIQTLGAPIPTMIIGTLPIAITLSSHFFFSKQKSILPWRRILPSLGLTALGIACVNYVELSHWQGHFSIKQYTQGLLLSILALACWTWYPIQNALWLKQHPQHASKTWATAQGLVTLPMALAGIAIFSLIQPQQLSIQPDNLMLFLLLTASLGLLCSWAGTLFWNKASLALPTHILAPLIVFETLFAILYAYIAKQTFPDNITLIGVSLLIIGVVYALKSPTPNTQTQTP